MCQGLVFARKKPTRVILKLPLQRPKRVSPKKKSCNVIFLLTTVCRKPVQLPEFKNPWNKVKVSTHCIGSDAENDEMEVDVAVDNPERASRHVACRQWSGRSSLPSRVRNRVLQSKQSTGLKLRDVQGNTLSHHGTRLNLTVGTQGQRANTDFQVADISDKILSNGICVRVQQEERLNHVSPNRRLFHCFRTRTVCVFMRDR